MKYNLITIGCLMSAASATAATWTVDSNTGRPADFRSLQAAHDSASVTAGDVLHVVASTISYGGLTMTKALSIIGLGYLLNQNLSFSVAAPSARAGSIANVTANGDGSETVTIEVDGSITDNQAKTFLRLKITLL